MDRYFDDLALHFDKKPPLRVMRSDGGFSNDKIKASNSLLSGPAGGLIGFSKLIPLI
jgi:N-methylhydantoinase A/oxoprolinase/acetone carboxylase beta subunit